MYISRIAATLALFLAAGSALAQMPAPASKDPAKVEAGTYAVEPNHTRVTFTVDHMGFTDYYGGFTGVSGTLQLDPKKPAGSTLEILIPIDTVGTTNAKLDEELKAADWLDATKYPTATFKTTSVKLTGKETADVTGDLTLHGVTKP